MTSIERIISILNHKKTDRIGVDEHFWGDTYSDWSSKGNLKENYTFPEFFKLDMDRQWSFNYIADLDFVEKIVDEDEDTYTALDGNGATLKRHKKHDTTPEHIAFSVTNREQWNEIKEKLTPDERRIDFAGYKWVKDLCVRDNRYFNWSGINVFEQMHPVCGHENMLMGMALDPEWIQDMCETFSNLNISLLETLFSKCGKPDGAWFYEDMGFKDKPFMSPAMYRELILPYHKKTIDFLHGQGLKVIMHSCGFVEPLLPHMIEAGIDALQVIEVKAGMDVLRINKNFGDKIALVGGIDVRALYSNDKKIIDAELESKIPFLKEKFNYVAHSDHSIPKTVDIETFQYYLEKVRKLGTF